MAVLGLVFRVVTVVPTATLRGVPIVLVRAIATLTCSRAGRKIELDCIDQPDWEAARDAAL